MKQPWCLPPEDVEKFKKGIMSGEIDPEKIAAMSSPERIKFFGEKFGKSLAVVMNSQVEKSLLAKNQRAAITAWARKMLAGEKNKAASEEAIREADAIKDFVQPEEQDALLKRLAAIKMRTDVSYDEALKIAELADEVQKTKEVADAGGDRIPYGKARYEMKRYVQGLMSEGAGFFNTEGVPAWEKPVVLSGRALKLVSDNSRAINAAWDDSALLRQGAPVLAAHPEIWKKHAKESFVNGAKSLKGEDVTAAVESDLMSRPLYDTMVRSGLSIAKEEEMFPTHLPAKVPIIGRAYTASEVMFSAFQHEVRADLFEKLVRLARIAGATLDEAQYKAISSLVNSLTGKGKITDKLGIEKFLQSLFFSPSFMKARLDRLIIHPLFPLKYSGMTEFTRNQARKNLLKWGLLITAVLGVAAALGARVSLDPYSSEFMKIRVGNMVFDPTAGMAADVVFAARELFGKVEDKHGRDVPMKTGGHGKELFRYGRNKLNPLAATVTDTLFGQRNYKPQTVMNALDTLFMPLPGKNTADLVKDEKNGPVGVTVGTLADLFGVSVGDYAPKQ